MSDLPNLSALKWCMLPDVLPPEVYSSAAMCVRQELYRMLGGETSEEWWNRPLICEEIFKCLPDHVEGLIVEEFP